MASHSDIVCFILKTYKSSFFREGSLLSLRNGERKLYAHHRPISSTGRVTETCSCTNADLAPVFDSDYSFIARIQNPEDRLDVFNRKLGWGKKLRKEDHAYVKLRKNPTEYAQVIVKYIGPTKLGLKFGVEIIVS